MKLSTNFSLAEMIKSSTAIRKGIDNTPDEVVTANLQAWLTMSCKLLEINSVVLK